MTRLFTDGAEAGEIFNVAYSSPSGYVNANTGQKRSGSYSYQVANAVAVFFLIPGSAKSEAYIRIAFYSSWYSDAGSYLCGWFYDTSTILGSIKSSATGHLDLYVGTTKMATGSGVFTAGAWNLLEVHVKIADAGGIIETKLNGVTDVSYSGDTKPSTQTTFSYVAMRSSGTGYIDDIAINDTDGASDNSWCGDGRIIALTPNANGDSSQFTGSDGNSTDNYLLVDEIPYNSDTDYVQSDTVGNKDLYNLSACGLSEVSIKRVWGRTVAKDTTTGGGSIAVVIKTNSTEYEGSTINLSTVYGAYDGTVHTTNPYTGAVWATSELDALQVGITIKA